MKLKALFYHNPAGFSAAILLLVATVFSHFINKQAFLILLISFLIVLFIDLIYSLLSLKATKKYVVALNKSLLSGKTGTISQFPLPAVMCDKYGNIVWYNDSFLNDIITTSEAEKITASDFFDDYSFEDYAQKGVVNAAFGDNQYTAFIVEVKSETSPMLCIYLFDDTALKEVALEYTYSRPFVMLLSIDNIEQLSRQLTDSKFAQVISGIEGHIEDWLKEFNVILKKIGNGNFLVIGEKRHLDKLKDEKFTILNAIREYKHKDITVDATVSIGVGAGEDFFECESRAKKSLDMALSRGGDQAAIYDGEGYVYFGGLSNRANDNSRVSPRQTAATISNLFKKYDKVIICGHKYSDYDSVGGSLGVWFFANACGLDAYVVVDEKTTLAEPLVNLLKEKEFKNFVSPSQAYDLCNKNTVVVIVDTQRKMLLDVPELCDKAGAEIIIDHHRRTEDYISDAEAYYCVPSASSACEMVAELIQYSTIQDKVTAEISTALLSGIALDTKDFVLRTSQRTFEAAGYLRDNGANTVQVRKFFAVDSQMAVHKHQIISSAKIFNGFIISSCSEEIKNIRIVSSVAADEMLNIDGVKASFVIYKLDNNKYQISARSLGEENVQLIMEGLGGGGHSTMAAAQVEAQSIAQVEGMLLEQINEYLNNK